PAIGVGSRSRAVTAVRAGFLLCVRTGRGARRLQAWSEAIAALAPALERPAGCSLPAPQRAPRAAPRARRGHCPGMAEGTATGCRRHPLSLLHFCLISDGC